MASFNSLDARKATFLLAPILIASPVAGLRPMRAPLFLTCNMPRPAIRIRSPFFKCLVIRHPGWKAVGSFVDATGPIRPHPHAGQAPGGRWACKRSFPLLRGSGFCSLKVFLGAWRRHRSAAPRVLLSPNQNDAFALG